MDVCVREPLQHGLESLPVALSQPRDARAKLSGSLPKLISIARQPVPVPAIRCFLIQMLRSALTWTNGCSCWSLDEEKWVQGFPYHGCALPTELGGKLPFLQLGHDIEGCNIDEGICTSSTHQRSAPTMIPDRCCIGPTRHCTPSPAPERARPMLLNCGLGEVAADRILHLQWFALPLELFTPAQPRLGRRPTPATRHRTWSCGQPGIR